MMNVGIQLCRRSKEHLQLIAQKRDICKHLYLLMVSQTTSSQVVLAFKRFLPAWKLKGITIHGSAINIAALVWLRRRTMFTETVSITPFSGQFRRQCMHFGNSAGNFGGSAVRRPVGHDSAAAMSKLVALLPNYMHIVQNGSEKGVYSLAPVTLSDLAGGLAKMFKTT